MAGEHPWLLPLPAPGTERLSIAYDALRSSGVLQREQALRNRSRLSPGRGQGSDVLWLKDPLHLINNLVMSDQPDQKPPGTALAFQQELIQAIVIWNKTPVSILDQQAVHTHALLLAMGKYITYRKEKRELENCTDASDFLDRFVKEL
jgi:hypothetical protein